MPRAQKTFRIFVSSTFSDLKEERNALQKTVFPKLRDLCRQNGFRFQAIDLRWGVREEAALDQQTVRICLDEIARCQQTTPRPNFIVLLGNRYGWQPLPYVIEASEFEALNSHVSGEEDQKLLATWYKRDDNNVPVMYCLQPRTVEVPKGKSEEEIRKIREKESEAWQQIEKKLQLILRSAVEKISLKDDQLIKYHASATEQEIITGTLIVPDAKEHVFGFFREISDMPQNKQARDYIDLNEQGDVDKEAQSKLEGLKRRLEAKIGKDNIFQYKAKWTGQGLTTDYLNKLCEDVYNSLAGVIQQSIQQLEEKDSLEQEIDAHDAFGLDRARMFIGRAQPLQTIHDYIRGTNPHALAVWGESGSGKSALMANAIKQAKREHPESEIIARFIGATPDSSDGRSLLESLCRQVSRIYGSDESAVPSDYKELIEAFFKQLALASKEKPLILFLDALDQLSDADNARTLIWLPPDLPEYVRVVVSTLPGECLNALHKLPDTSRIQLTPMLAREGEALLDVWLKEAGRTLQQPQRKLVLDHFSKNGLPLYLKLAFEEARCWKSFTPKIQLNPDIPGLIRALFARLSMDINHGEIIVSRSLGYMAAGKNGLSEDELIDVLSRDHDVFEDFKNRSYHQPPEQRLPVVVWSRLYFDLEPYLAERKADGVSLLSFYHRQLGEVVIEDYLSDNMKKARHQALASYFGEQALYIVKDNNRISNLRKLSELPYQQNCGKLWEKLEQTLSDFGFLQAKVVAGLHYDALNDFVLVNQCLPKPESKYEDKYKDFRTTFGEFSSAFNQEFYTFQSYPYITTQQLYNNIYAHNEFSGRVGAILKQFREHKKYPDKIAWFCRLNIAPTTSISRALLRTLADHKKPITSLAVSPKGTFIASADTAGIIKIWRQKDGALNVNFTGHHDGIDAICWVYDDKSESRIISLGRDQFIRVWDWRAEREIRNMRITADRIRAMIVMSDGKHIVTCGDDRKLRVWDLETKEEEFSLSGHQGRVFCIAIDQSGKILVSGSEDRTIKIWNLEQQSQLSTLRGHESNIRCVTVDTLKNLVITGSDDMTLKVWDIQQGYELRTITGHRNRITCIAIAPESSLVVSGSDDKTLKIWDIRSGLLRKTLSGHSKGINVLGMDPREKWCVSGGEDCTVRIWDATVEDKRMVEIWEHEGRINSICSNEHNSLIASASDDHMIKIWEGKNGIYKLTLRGHVAPVTCIKFINEKLLISGSSDRMLKVWDVSNGKLLYTLGTLELGLVSTITRVTTLSRSNVLPELYKASGGHTKPVTCLGIVGRNRVVSGGKDSTARLWNIESGKEIGFYEGLKGTVEYIQVNQNHNTIIAAGSGREIIIWDKDTRVVKKQLLGHNSSITCLLLANENLLISGSLDQTIRLWQLDSENSISLDGHKSRVNCIAVNNNSDIIVSGSNDADVKVWSAINGELIHTLTGHQFPISAIVFDSTNKRIFSSDLNGQIIVWEIESGRRVTSMNIDCPITSMIFIANNIICIGTNRGGLSLFEFLDE